MTNSVPLLYEGAGCGVESIGLKRFSHMGQGRAAGFSGARLEADMEGGRYPETIGAPFPMFETREPMHRPGQRSRSSALPRG